MRWLLALLFALGQLAALTIDGPATARGTVGAPFACAIITTGSAASFTATGLPAGLSLDAASGRITGTPTTVGSATVNVGASDGSGSASSSIVFTIDASSTAAVTNASYVALTVGSACSFRMSTPTTTPVYLSTDLPSGLFDDGTGLITGTPFAAGISNVQLSADAGTSATTMIMQVFDAQIGAPAVTLPVQPQAAVGAPFACWIHAAGASDYSVSGRPAWLGLDTATGLLSGTPTSGSSHLNLRVTVSSNSLSTTTSLAIVVSTPATGLPVPTSPASLEATVGSGIGWQARASADATWSAIGLPSGFALDPSSGQLSGTPTTDGYEDVLLTAASITTSETVTTTLAVRTYPTAVDAPVISGQAPPALTVGAPAAIALLSTGGTPTTFGLSDPSAAFSISSDGIITGTPAATGVVPLRVSAANTSGSAVTTLMVVIGAASGSAPLPGTPVIWRATTDSACVFDLGASTTPDSWSVSGLPTGLVLAPAVGRISGTPVIAGNANLLLSCTVGVASNATHAVIQVTGASITAPRIAEAGPWFLTVGQSAAIHLVDAGGTSTWTATGLPAGLAIATTGAITGTPTAAGSSMPVIAATRGVETSTTTGLVIVSAATTGAPVITSPTALTGTVGVAFSATITASGSPLDYAASPLPGWLSLDTTAGTLSGTPTASGTHVLQIAARNASGTTRTVAVITISAPAGGTSGGSQVGGISGGGCGAGAAGVILALSACALGRLRRHRVRDAAAE